MNPIINNLMININNQTNIHYKNKTHLETKLQRLVQDGYNKLYIISDFDATLTKYSFNGKKMLNTHKVITQTDIVSEGFKIKELEVNAKYIQYVKNYTKNFEENEEHIVNWWNAIHSYYIEEELTLNKIQQGLSKYEMNYRQDSDRFFNLINKNKIPLLIFSAGLTDIIQHLLLNKGYFNNNIHIISNTMIFSKEEPYRLIGFKEPLIHILNKGDVLINELEFNQQIKNKHNCILLGDSLSDLNMSNNFNPTTLLTIGFVNHNTEVLLPEYIEKYDVVITEDGSLEWVNELLELMK
ncbi:HAD-superfamily hydrolase [Neoconidiobolus thromboides FSU 785]|nr:HAD-superfamily hydrolase [Neoconidiobolus thromboides FSU 785]